MHRENKLSTKLEIKVSYHYGTAADSRLDLYDAGVSIQGMARALAISTHAFLNEGEIRKRANAATGAEIYISPSRRGSFQEIITIILEHQAPECQPHVRQSLFVFLYKTRA